MSHCGWCTAGSRAVIVAELRADPCKSLRLIAERYRVGYYYAEKVRAKARKLGCLTAQEPVPPPPRPVAWTLPPIGAVYLTAPADARVRPH